MPASIKFMRCLTPRLTEKLQNVLLKAIRTGFMYQHRRMNRLAYR